MIACGCNEDKPLEKGTGLAVCCAMMSGILVARPNLAGWREDRKNRSLGRTLLSGYLIGRYLWVLSWRQVSENAERSLWGAAYKSIMRNLGLNGQERDCWSELPCGSSQCSFRACMHLLRVGRGAPEGAKESQEAVRELLWRTLERA